MKKILAIVLAMVLVLSLTAVAVSAEDCKKFAIKDSSIKGTQLTPTLGASGEPLYVDAVWKVVLDANGDPFEVLVDGYDSDILKTDTKYTAKILSANYVGIYNGDTLIGTTGLDYKVKGFTFAKIQFRFFCKDKDGNVVVPGVGSSFKFKIYTDGAAVWIDIYQTGDDKPDFFLTSPGKLDITIDEANFKSDVFEKDGDYTVVIEPVLNKNANVYVTGPKGLVRFQANAAITTEKSDDKWITTVTIDGVKFVIDGKITSGSFVVTYSSSCVAPAASGSTGGSGGTQAPKTGDSSAAVALAGLALVSAAAVVFSRKK